LENLMVIAEEQLGESLFNAWFRTGQVNRQQKLIARKALDILRFIELEQKKDLPAKYLSGGEKKLLEIGRMMMVDLEMVLLDEPGAGVPPALQNKIMDYIRSLSREHGLTLFIVEHDMDTIIVMVEGSTFTQGTPEQVRSNPAVIEAYLGRVGEEKV